MYPLTASTSTTSSFRRADRPHVRDDLFATLERALEDALRQAGRERWLAENARSINAYNAQIGEHGAFADTLRRF